MPPYYVHCYREERFFLTFSQRIAKGKQLSLMGTIYRAPTPTSPQSCNDNELLNKISRPTGARVISRGSTQIYIHSLDISPKTDNGVNRSPYLPGVSHTHPYVRGHALRGFSLAFSDGDFQPVISNRWRMSPSYSSWSTRY